MKDSSNKEQVDGKRFDKIKTWKSVSVGWSTSVMKLDCFTLAPYKMNWWVDGE
jgi:hypothetical protein